MYSCRSRHGRLFSSQYFLPSILTKQCQILLGPLPPSDEMWVILQDTSFCYLKCVGSIIKAISTQNGLENNGHCVLLTFKRTILCTKSTFISDKDYPFKGIMYQMGFHSNLYLPVKSAIDGMQSTGELHKLKCIQGLSKQREELLVYLIIAKVYYGNLNQQEMHFFPFRRTGELEEYYQRHKRKQLRALYSCIQNTHLPEQIHSRQHIPITSLTKNCRSKLDRWKTVGHGRTFLDIFLGNLTHLWDQLLERLNTAAIICYVPNRGFICFSKCRKNPLLFDV